MSHFFGPDRMVGHGGIGSESMLGEGGCNYSCNNKCNAMMSQCSIYPTLLQLGTKQWQVRNPAGNTPQCISMLCHPLSVKAHLYHSNLHVITAYLNKQKQAASWRKLISDHADSVIIHQLWNGLFVDILLFVPVCGQVTESWHCMHCLAQCGGSAAK